MVEPQPSKLAMPVRSRSPAPSKTRLKSRNLLQHNAFRRIESRSKGRQRRPNNPSLKSWGCLPGEDVSVVCRLAPIEHSTPPASGPGRVIPFVAQGVRPAHRGHHEPSRNKVRAGTAARCGTRRRSLRPDQRPPFLAGIPRGSHEAPTRSGADECARTQLHRDRNRQQCRHDPRNASLLRTGPEVLRAGHRV